MVVALNPWIAPVSIHSLPQLSYGILPVSLHMVFCSYKDISYNRLEPPNDLILTWLHLQRLFPNKVTLIRSPPTSG